MSSLRRCRQGTGHGLVALGAGLLLALPMAMPVAAAAPLRVGLVLPLRGDAAALAGQEQAGVDIARDMINADGGVAGRPVELVVRDVERWDRAQLAIDSLRAADVSVVIGAYSSELSMAASTAAATDGLVYWESGAVADQLTGRGLPLVFRVGASGSVLGSGSADFVAQILATRLGITPGQLRVAVVQADDDYATSVAEAAITASDAAGMQLVARLTYDLLQPDWASVIGQLETARPDVLILASHILDGVQFRQAMLAAGLRVGAFIGSTMAQCGPEWGKLLQADAIGTFASDRPTGGFDPDALLPAARADYDRFAAAWKASLGGEPTEEGLAGFAAAWALFHDVLPAASAPDDAAAVAAAARSLDLPQGSLPNGAGLRFSSDAATLGQNVRAASVIWQWQAVEHSVTVWPPVYATGGIGFVPLPR